MKILMLNWRDLKNPKAGGAEVLTEGILSRLSSEHDITLFSAKFPGGAEEENVNGYRVIRKGTPATVHWQAYREWKKRFSKEKFDVVIDQIHGVPFFTPLYVKNVKIFAFIHEVAKDIWKNMYPFPIGQIGYYLEPQFYRFYKDIPFITVSDSTKKDLIEMGIPEKNIAITPEAIDDEMFVDIPNVSKEKDPTIVVVGRLAKMKRPDHVIEAFKIAREKINNLKLWIIGGGDAEYVNYLKKLSENLPVEFYGRVNADKKKELLKRAWILASSSMKEGFGLVVLEAGAMQTPSVVYAVPGFRDSVKHMETGVLSKPEPKDLAKAVVSIIKDKGKYNELKMNAYEHSQNFTFNHASKAFFNLLS